MKKILSRIFDLYKPTVGAWGWLNCSTQQHSWPGCVHTYAHTHLSTSCLPWETRGSRYNGSGMEQTALSLLYFLPWVVFCHFPMCALNCLGITNSQALSPTLAQPSSLVHLKLEVCYQIVGAGFASDVRKPHVHAGSGWALVIKGSSRQRPCPSAPKLWASLHFVCHFTIPCAGYFVFLLFIRWQPKEIYWFLYLKGDDKRGSSASSLPRWQQPDWSPRLVPRT